jgi:epoxyqueuosine reductase QueG
MIFYALFVSRRNYCVKKMNKAQSTKKIKSLCIEFGADLVGVADLKLMKGVFTHPSDLLGKYRYAISLAVNLDRFGGYDNKTEGLAFSLLDKIALSLKKHIEDSGHQVKIIPPDKRVEKNGPLYWRGAISHKAVAKTAGLGWIGRNMLLITPRFGPRVCLITILTDVPLTPNKPSRNRCRTCKECIKSCPTGALIEVEFDDHPEKLEEAFEIAKCGPWIDKTWYKGKICYECMLACTWEKEQKANSE